MNIWISTHTHVYIYIYWGKTTSDGGMMGSWWDKIFYIFTDVCGKFHVEHDGNQWDGMGYAILRRPRFCEKDNSELFIWVSVSGSLLNHLGFNAKALFKIYLMFYIPWMIDYGKHMFSRPFRQPILPNIHDSFHTQSSSNVFLDAVDSL